MFLGICVGILAFFVIFLMGRVSRQKSEIKFHREALEYKLIGESSKIQEVMGKIIDQNVKIGLNSDYTIELIKEIVAKKKASQDIPVHLPPANRKPRTEEQKRVAAEKKKAWWVAKRAEEALKKTQQLDGVSPTLTTNAS